MKGLLNQPLLEISTKNYILYDLTLLLRIIAPSVLLFCLRRICVRIPTRSSSRLWLRPTEVSMNLQSNDEARSVPSENLNLYRGWYCWGSLTSRCHLPGSFHVQLISDQYSCPGCCTWLTWQVFQNLLGSWKTSSIYDRVNHHTRMRLICREQVFYL